jgi:hypothetical protein
VHEIGRDREMDWCVYTLDVVIHLAEFVVRSDLTSQTQGAWKYLVELMEEGLLMGDSESIDV